MAKKSRPVKKTVPQKASSAAKALLAKKAKAAPAPQKAVKASKKAVKASPKAAKTPKKAAKTPKKAAPKKSVFVSAKRQALIDRKFEKVLPGRATPVYRPAAPKEFSNTAQGMAFSFAEEMKRAYLNSLNEPSKSDGIRLSRRPTSRSRSEMTLAFSAADLEEFRRKLILLRQTAMGKSSMLRSVALEQSDERGDEEEDGSDVFMRLQNLGQVDTQNRIIQKIDDALRRIADGTYGICEECGQLIRKPRLLNLPFVHMCMECQNAMEAERARKGRRG